mmetsp:Transcript_30065/g.59014  ORF Transcript_30065/g.59014 Transcript_30065/m.59014 type:complete len:148 (+) Transcript_30065:5273-5716(+)
MEDDDVGELHGEGRGKLTPVSVFSTPLPFKPQPTAFGLLSLASNDRQDETGRTLRPAGQGGMVEDKDDDAGGREETRTKKEELGHAERRTNEEDCRRRICLKGVKEEEVVSWKRGRTPAQGKSKTDMHLFQLFRVRKKQNTKPNLKP